VVASVILSGLAGVAVLFKRAEETDPLLAHYAAQVRDQFLLVRCELGGAITPSQALVIEHIEELLKTDGPPDWGRVYQIESLLVHLKTGKQLVGETERRVDEATRAGLASAPKLREQLDRVKNAPSGTDEDYRAILTAATDDLQWYYLKRILIRSERGAAAVRLRRFGWVALLVVSIPFLAFVFEKYFPWKPFSMLMADYPNYGVFTAMSFGLLGAFFSRLISLQVRDDKATLEDVRTDYGYSFLTVRAGVGICGAVIVYFLLRSQILGTTIAPDFEKLGYEPISLQTVLGDSPATVRFPSKDWALLVIWSFLAGFSEKLVPDSLSRAETQLSAANKQDTGKQGGQSG
jgi:hypothetical protein